jgi:hypothetical protein
MAYVNSIKSKNSYRYVEIPNHVIKLNSPLFSNKKAIFFNTCKSLFTWVNTVQLDVIFILTSMKLKQKHPTSNAIGYHYSQNNYLL